jgi:hypothetical protein
MGLAAILATLGLRVHRSRIGSIINLQLQGQKMIATYAARKVFLC